MVADGGGAEAAEGGGQVARFVERKNGPSASVSPFFTGGGGRGGCMLNCTRGLRKVGWSRLPSLLRSRAADVAAHNFIP